MLALRRRGEGGDSGPQVDRSRLHLALSRSRPREQGDLRGLHLPLRSALARAWASAEGRQELGRELAELLALDGAGRERCVDLRQREQGRQAADPRRPRGAEAGAVVVRRRGLRAEARHPVGADQPGWRCRLACLRRGAGPLPGEREPGPRDGESSDRRRDEGRDRVGRMDAAGVVAPRGEDRGLRRGARRGTGVSLVPSRALARAEGRGRGDGAAPGREGEARA